MSLADLGARMGTSAQSAQSAERSEQAGTIQLNTLQRIATALDCTVAYVLVPNTSLSGAMAAQAEVLLSAQSVAAEQSMLLEAQPAALLPAARQALLEQLVERGALWRTT